LQRSGIHNAKLQIFNDSFERRFGHSSESGMSAMDPIQMQSKLEALNADETTAFGLRLMRNFLRLRDKQHREELIALAERLANEEEKCPAESGD
jgi:hypothetical protein